MQEMILSRPYVQTLERQRSAVVGGDAEARRMKQAELGVRARGRLAGLARSSSAWKAASWTVGFVPGRLKEQRTGWWE